MINNHKAFFEEACIAVLGKNYRIEVADNLTEDDEEDDTKKTNPIPEETNTGFNPRYTFDTFVKGPNNQLAVAACLAIATAKGYVKEYNPLFIYSGPGLGKTHLMHAVGQYVTKTYPKKNVLYVSSEAFTNELVTAIRDKTTDKFHNKYRKVDLLLFDDVQFLSGKDRTQEELFHTFDALYNARKQIIFTSDKPPKDLEGIPERLTTRFGWGLPVDIQAPEYETRVAILINLATLNGIEITPEVQELLNVIAENVTGNIRDLEGAFTRVHAMSQLQGLKMNKNLARDVLTEVFNIKKQEVTPEDIKKTVAKYFGIKISDMESEKRSKNIAYPRQIAIYLIREHTNYSLPQMGKLFGGRDHTTIRHSYEKMVKEIEKSEDLKNTVDNIYSMVEG
jgi:chromosomal replication initiator protein